MIGFALVLFLGAAAGWMAAEGTVAPTRGYLRLAAVLYCTMALSEAFAVAPPQVRAIVMAFAATVLALAAYAAIRKAPRLLIASIVLAVAALGGIAAAMLGQSILTASPQLLSVLFILLIARRSAFTAQRSGLYFCLSALCILGAAACGLLPPADLMARAGLLLFAAAGVAGTALASNLLVVERGNHRGAFAIRRTR